MSGRKLDGPKGGGGGGFHQLKKRGPQLLFSFGLVSWRDEHRGLRKNQRMLHKTNKASLPKVQDYILEGSVHLHISLQV